MREWHGWVFVDRTGRGMPFEDHIGELEDVVAPYGAADLVTPVSHEYDVAANWKVIIENYQECYHCSMIHPELCRVSPPESGENIERDGNWVGGWMDLRDGAQTMSLDGRSGGVAIARLDEHEKRTVMYVAVLPNLLISLHPDYVMTPPAHPARARPHPDPVLVGVPGGRGERRGLRPVVRRGLLGPDQPPGLVGVRVGAARDEGARASSPARWRRARTASTTSSATSPGPTRGPAS